MVDAPEDHSDTLHLLSIPAGAQIPRLADWAVPASIPTSPENAHLAELALASIAVAYDLTTNYDVADEDETAARVKRLHTFNSTLQKVTDDIGPIRLSVTPDQAAEIAEAARAIARPATVVELAPHIVWELLDQLGHGEHGGWTQDSRHPDLVCACGDAVFRLTVPAPVGR
ncbi:hypothetical protein [Nonomuraea recticatena]